MKSRVQVTLRPRTLPTHLLTTIHCIAQVVTHTIPSHHSHHNHGASSSYNHGQDDPNSFWSKSQAKNLADHNQEHFDNIHIQIIENNTDPNIRRCMFDEVTRIKKEANSRSGSKLDRERQAHQDILELQKWIKNPNSPPAGKMHGCYRR
jgi:hypothetical protein